MNRLSKIRPNLQRRAKIIRAIRDFFTQEGFLETETPIRIPAPAPEAHIDAQEAGDWFLHPSPELCMKRMLAAGYKKIFQICRCFRKGERGGRHVPEMTLLEWYAVENDYFDLMRQCEDLFGFVANRLDMDRFLYYRENRIDLTPPWNRMSVRDAFHHFGSMSVEAALEKDRFDEIMGLEIEPRLGFERPLFLYDYPASCGSLARLKPGNQTVAERFELYVAGLELCNGFSELTDPFEQRHRFESENKTRRAGGKFVYPMAEPFLEALASMPDAAGNALGIDRLIMLFCDVESIDEVIAFTPEEL